MGVAVSKELLDVIGEAALKYGILEITHQGLTIKFTDKVPRIVMPFNSQQPISPSSYPIGEEHGMPTEDELLFASSIPLTPDELAARPPR